MIIVENLMIVFLVTMILGAILMIGGGSTKDDYDNADDVCKVFGFGVVTFTISLLAIIFLFGYSDSLEVKIRVDIAEHEDAIFRQIDIIKELECDENSNKYEKEISKLRKCIREYNSAVRKYTEEETYPKTFYFYKYEDGNLVTKGTNRDLR